MAELVVACFDTQFQASAAAEKLISLGFQREQIVLTFDESVGNIPSSSSAPTTVISDVSHTGHVDTATGEPRRRDIFPTLRAPQQAPDPTLIGHTTLVVRLQGEMSMDDVCAWLDDAGASSVNTRDQEEPRSEKPTMWPAIGKASREDIQRSIDAARGGAALKAQNRR